jgi:hypothetical protein
LTAIAEPTTMTNDPISNATISLAILESLLSAT